MRNKTFENKDKDAGVNKCLYSPAKAGEQLRILGLLGKSFGWCEAPPETLP